MAWTCSFSFRFSYRSMLSSKRTSFVDTLAIFFYSWSIVWFRWSTVYVNKLTKRVEDKVKTWFCYLKFRGLKVHTVLTSEHYFQSIILLFFHTTVSIFLLRCLGSVFHQNVDYHVSYSTLDCQCFYLFLRSEPC